MPDVTVPPPVATGTLARTPLAHLIVYVLRKRLDGSLVFKGAVEDEHVVFFRSGMPALVKSDFDTPALGQIAVDLGLVEPALHDEALRAVGSTGLLHLELIRSFAKLSLLQFETCQREHLMRAMVAMFRFLGPDCSYAFYPDVNLASSAESDAPMPIDPYPLLWRAACTAPCEPEIELTLGRLGQLPVQLARDAVVDDFGFGEEELGALQALRGKEHTLEALVASGHLPEKQWRRLVYVLLITRNLQVGTVGRQSMSPPANPLRSMLPPPLAQEPPSQAAQPPEKQAANAVAPAAAAPAEPQAPEPSPQPPTIELAVPRESLRPREPLRPRQDSEPPAQHAAAPPPPPSFAGIAWLYTALAAALLPLLLGLRGTVEPAAARLQDVLQQPLGNTLQPPRVLLTGSWLAALPGARLEGAHLAFNGAGYWVYAGLSAAAFALLLAWVARRSRLLPGMLAQAAFMAAAGALLVLGVAHFVSTGAATAPADATGAWHGVQQAIAWSYRSALDPAVSLAASFAAYTLGVGLVAGVMKAAPLLLELRTENDLSWRGAAAMGMGAGAAFGVVEAVMYCMHHLNGIEPAAAYQAVFASSVAVHGCCGAAAALALHARQDVLQTHGAGAAWALHVLRLLAAPVVLQGMYDTLLKRGMHGGALLAGAGALAWFAWHLESSRTEAARAAARAH